MNLSEISDAGDALATTLAASAVDPADRLRLMLALAASAPTGNVFGSALRRSALIQAALASAAYQPSSYDDAVATRQKVCAALDAEIFVAGDNGEDTVYLAFRALRVSVAVDLRTRGEPLPRLRTLTVPALPAEVLAYRLYGDATRAAEIVARVDPPDPLSMPTQVTVLDR